MGQLSKDGKRAIRQLIKKLKSSKQSKETSFYLCHFLIKILSEEDYWIAVNFLISCNGHNMYRPGTPVVMDAKVNIKLYSYKNYNFNSGFAIKFANMARLYQLKLMLTL